MLDDLLGRGRRRHPRRGVALPDGEGSVFGRWASEGNWSGEGPSGWTESEAQHHRPIPPRMSERRCVSVTVSGRFESDQLLTVILALYYYISVYGPKESPWQAHPAVPSIGSSIMGSAVTYRILCQATELDWLPGFAETSQYGPHKVDAVFSHSVSYTDYCHSRILRLELIQTLACLS